MLIEICKRIKYWNSVDRIGPDIPTTHWMLYFKSTMFNLCKKRFMNFDVSSEFRPGAYAINCSNISIGKHVIIRPTTMLFASTDSDAKIIIEDGAMLGSGVHIYVTTHSYGNINVPIIEQGYYKAKSVVLKKGCWIGSNTIILPGVTIGENSVVGAGSVVIKDIPDRFLAMGNPAKILRKIDENNI